MIDAESCYRALRARDARFDGAFFVGVVTTGIYCRPVCPARRPRRESCRFFPVAAGAEAAGFRPCRRCRPELAPGAAPIDGARGLVAAAVARIEGGALSSGSVGELAADLGIGERQLRRRFEAELGVGPRELAQTHRLLTAKRLLTDTAIPVTRVAFAAGFGSVRRFNSAFQDSYGMTPTALRGRGRAADDACVVSHLAYRPPLQWERLLAFLAPRAIPGIEAVEGDEWARWIRVGEEAGRIRVGHAPATASLRVQVPANLVEGMMGLLHRVRRLFDLDAEPAVIDEHLARDAALAPLVARRPGLRVPGAWDGFEVAWRAVLGQQVSVKGATTLAGRLVQRFGSRLDVAGGEAAFIGPEPRRLARARVDDLAKLGITRGRSAAIIGLARAARAGEVPLEPIADPAEAERGWRQLAGFGPWTASYLALRTQRDPDAFPSGDLALRRALGERSEKELLCDAERWRPWRAYAALHLWNSLMEEERT